MSSSLIRQDLVPMMVGYALVMGTLAAGLLILRRDRAAGPGTGPEPGPSDGPAGPGTVMPGGRAWLRLIRHLAATFAGGYLLLMAVVIAYYLGIAPRQRQLPGQRLHRLCSAARFELTGVSGRIVASRAAGPPPCHRRTGSSPLPAVPAPDMRPAHPPGAEMRRQQRHRDGGPGTPPSRGELARLLPAEQRAPVRLNCLICSAASGNQS